MSLKIEMTMPSPPEGFEYTGEYRFPKIGDWYMTNAGTVGDWQLLPHQGRG